MPRRSEALALRERLDLCLEFTQTDVGVSANGGSAWVWREDIVQELLAADDVDLLFISGCAPNQGKFYPQFDHIILLSAHATVIAHRLATRTNNPYGKDPEQLARTLELKRTIEPMLRRGAGLEIDTTAPLDEIVGAILRHVQAR